MHFFIPDLKIPQLIRISKQCRCHIRIQYRFLKVYGNSKLFLLILKELTFFKVAKFVNLSRHNSSSICFCTEFSHWWADTLLSGIKVPGAWNFIPGIFFWKTCWKLSVKQKHLDEKGILFWFLTYFTKFVSNWIYGCSRCSKERSC